VSETPALYERLTKLVIICSAIAAAWMQLWLLSTDWPQCWILAAAVFAAAYAGGRWRPAATRRVVMFLTYLIPAFFVVRTGTFEDSEWIIWIALIYGVMLPSRRLLRWSLPVVWRLPLAFWAVLCASTWPIVMLRESDFDLSRIPSPFGAVSAEAALFVLTGILWFDWLYSEYAAADRSRFEAEILLPLGIGWIASAALAVYQMLGRMAFINPEFWVALARATGSLGDANILGILSALWGPALVVVAAGRSNWKAWSLGAFALLLSWLAVWASGSRSSMVIVVLGVAGILYGVWRSTGSKRLITFAAIALVLVAMTAATTVVRTRPSVVGPITRLVDDFRPRWSTDWLRFAGSYLWTRNGYGVVAGDMIQQSPLVGIGLGAFHPLVYLYSWRLFHVTLPPDNAQNWFRHQIAELGILGSVGWAAWSALLLVLLLTAPTNTLAGAVVRVILIGFGLVSLVGVPSQSLAVAVTFWTFAWWFINEVGGRKVLQNRTTSTRRMAWAALWLLVLAHGAVSVRAARTYLRPPIQAMRADIDYSTGLYEPEGDPPFRWTKQRAVAVMPVTKRWLKLEVLVNHDDLAQKPVDARVWVNGQLTLDTWLKSPAPTTRYALVGDGPKRFMLETWVSRVVRPTEIGLTDPRELGLMLRWSFVDAPPADATVSAFERPPITIGSRPAP
jgi:O-antigen ligase